MDYKFKVSLCYMVTTVLNNTSTLTSFSCLYQGTKTPLLVSTLSQIFGLSSKQNALTQNNLHSTPENIQALHVLTAR